MKFNQNEDVHRVINNRSHMRCKRKQTEETMQQEETKEKTPEIKQNKRVNNALLAIAFVQVFPRKN